MAASPARRLLQTNSGQYPTLLPAAADPPNPLAVDSDVVVILAALLCALICVAGLAAVARCRGGAAPPSAAAAKGLRKKALRALPRLAYEDAVAAAAAARDEGSVAVAAGEEDKILLAECAICLSDFAPREEIRVLPQCGHGFHVACVDTWLAAHSSCPSCRRVLVVDQPQPPPEAKRCRKCEAAATEEASSSSNGSGGSTGRSN